MEEQFFMHLALSLGEKGRLLAPGNPWVGCVICQNKEIVGQGYHNGPGTPHAEIHALQEAGEKAKGSTVYITLEPCSHQGRTPPCTAALIEAGVAHVHIPFLDPDPNVSGRGVKALEEAGIQVTTGLCSEETQKSLAPYLHHRKTGLPYCILKAAVSFDGRLAAADGTSKWISSTAARQNAHLLRAQSQAILVGGNTAAMDKPKLTVRDLDQPFNPPLRIALDSSTLDPESVDLDLIFTTDSSKWQDHEHIVLPTLDPNLILKELGRRNLLQLLVEGGSKVHTSFLNHANQLTLYVGNCLLGNHGLPLFHLDIPTMEQAPRLTLSHISAFDQTVRLDYLREF